MSDVIGFLKSDARTRTFLAMLKSMSFGWLGMFWTGVLVAGMATAAPGDLDTGFGQGGFTGADIPQVSGYTRNVLVQPDGKILASGQPTSHYDFAIVRYQLDGSLDRSFGNDGLVLTDLSGKDWFEDALAMVLQPDGKIVLAGYLEDNRKIFHFALARFSKDGQLDASFGKRGVVLTRPPGNKNGGVAQALALLPNGKLLVGGDSAGYFTLARYTSNGKLDRKFGTNGFARTQFPERDFSVISDIKVQPDGNIVVAGVSGKLGVQESADLALARYKTNGQLDRRFGQRGRVLTDFGNDRDVIAKIALLADGRIIAAGDSDWQGKTRAILAGYLSNGQLDANFGSAGKVIEEFKGFDGFRAIVVQTDGKIITGGVANPPPQPNRSESTIALARYQPNGHPDTSFGAGGRALIEVPERSTDLSSLALQADGKLLAGTSSISRDTMTTFLDFPVARIEP